MQENKIKQEGEMNMLNKQDGISYSLLTDILCQSEGKLRAYL